MDDMLQSNEINMNLAAVTPAALILYIAQRGVSFLKYALFKLGKSRAETYATFRQIILDIERLLVMRDNPPSAPRPLSWGVKPERAQELSIDKKHGSDTLSADDTGMLMLLIHECRAILWQDKSRFTTATVRNVAEDLAELAGERGKNRTFSLVFGIFLIILTPNSLCRRCQCPTADSHRWTNGKNIPVLEGIEHRNTLYTQPSSLSSGIEFTDCPASRGVLFLRQSKRQTRDSPRDTIIIEASIRLCQLLQRTGCDSTSQGFDGRNNIFGVDCFSR
jgi:hypothetical protein